VESITCNVMTLTDTLTLNGLPLPVPSFGPKGASATTMIVDESLAAKHAQRGRV
jgi:hypothetical protein